MAPLGRVDSGTTEVVNAFTELKEETGLLAGISDYIFEIINRYDKEVLKMYTREDFLREHPREERPLFFFPWDKERYLRDMETTSRKSRLEGEVKGEMKGKLEGELRGQLKLLEEIHKDGLLSKKQFLERATPLHKKLEQFQSDT